MTRRELLAAFLGAQAAALLPGCGGAETPLPPGEIVGASDGIGHMLRDGFRPVPAADAWLQTDTLIVGGGVAGLSAAWRLERAGARNFRVVELERKAGGTAQCGTSPYSAFPWGAHYIPAPSRENQPLITLLNELGIVEGADARGEPIIAEQHLVRDPQERIFYRGRWYEGLYLRAGASAEDLRQFAAFKEEMRRWARWRDKNGRHAFAIPTALCSDDAAVMELDRISMAEYLAQRKWGSPRLCWHVEYACRDDYGLTLEHTSAWAGVFYFASRMREGATDEAQPLITWPQGNGRLVEHLSRVAGERLSLGIAVTDLSQGKDGVEGVCYEPETKRVFGIRAKRAIFAAPQFLARALIRPFRENPPAHIREFEYGAWMVANLFLRERPAEESFPLCWDNVLYESQSLGYVDAAHQSDIERGPTVLTYYYPFCDSDPRQSRTRLLSAGRDEWAEVALSDISRAHPEIRALTERLDVMRWGHAMIRPRPGFIGSAGRKKAAEPHGAIHFAHSDLSGIALFEEAFHHGLRAADEILKSKAFPI